MMTTAMSIAVFLMAFAIQVQARPVDRERAHQMALNFMNANGLRSAQLNDVTTAAGFSNIYVFTAEDGFVLMSADDCMPPILAYSLNGAFDFENMPDNKRAWIEEYSQIIQSAIDQHQDADPEIAQQWRDLAEGNNSRNARYVVVEPMTQTHWNQSDPYNLLCPSNSVTGCVATAMAQVMKYWNYPHHGIGSHSYTHPTYGVLSADFQSTIYDWANMLNNYNGSSNSTQNMAVATLMYHCGVSVDMEYSPTGSGAVTAKVANALKAYFNYSNETQHLDRASYSDDEWIALLKADLDQGRPVLYHGSGNGGGHAFVFDGYNSDNYFHVNWGWGGYCDEYYVVNNLNPGPGGIGSGSLGVYNDFQGAVVGIHPSESIASAPTNLTYTQTESTITLTWTAATGAASYNIYCNGSLIGNTSSTTYTHNAPHGTSVYIVRSVDANGYLSLSSNAVTVTVDYLSPVVDDLAATVSGSDVTLTWSAPEWCYPTSPTATLSYGEGPVYYSWTSTYYGHRYLAADLAQYANKAVYKVETYIQYPGTYTVYVYTASTSNNQPDANALAFTQVMDFDQPGWQGFNFDAPVLLSGTDDLWVVWKVENTNQAYPTPSFNLDSYNANACYNSTYSPTSLSSVSSNYTISWLIRTCLTDGTYTYNLYRDDTSIADNLSGTTYSDSNLPDGTYTYYVKTNYYGGETGASNPVTVEVGNTTVTQTTSLTEGWNWWSPFIDQESIDGLLMLENSLGTNGIRIQSKTGGVDYYEYQGSGSWYGNLNALSNGQMYKIRTSQACEVELTGNPIVAESLVITLYEGWNWIGFPSGQSISLEAALSDFNPEPEDIIKGRSGSASFFSSGQYQYWYGTLTTLEPGQGYMYKSNSPTPKTLVFQIGRNNGEQPVKE